MISIHISVTGRIQDNITGEEKNKLPESSTKWKRKLSTEPLNNKRRPEATPPLPIVAHLPACRCSARTAPSILRHYMDLSSLPLLSSPPLLPVLPLFLPFFLYFPSILYRSYGKV
eukprot:TRINITY_DN5204_c0_g2_i1.p1 TRINITY_DN5204_c0_g2~~TRINITY_DN5204_c0_g2_i1.p1  ORF type:complete len:115 (-),score=14.57 TRINITY_DN5204_c0_g2_i1:330-674(-)